MVRSPELAGERARYRALGSELRRLTAESLRDLFDPLAQPLRLRVEHPPHGRRLVEHVSTWV